MMAWSDAARTAAAEARRRKKASSAPAKKKTLAQLKEEIRNMKFTPPSYMGGTGIQSKHFESAVDRWPKLRKRK